MTRFSIDPLPIEELHGVFAEHGQEHVFAWWDRLDPPEQLALRIQATRIAPGLASFVKAVRGALPSTVDPAGGSLAPGLPPIEPPDVIELPKNEQDAQRAEEARKVGEEILAAGRVGVFVVAGGQGTRLGFPHPKGCFPVGPISDRSLFEIQAQKIRGLARRSGCRVPWYVMTSAATDAETRAAFTKAGFFGLDPADVSIFVQDMVPAFDLEGRIVLEAPGRIFESPNGHGGALTALESAGALDDMARRGIDTLFFYQVDNPLVRIADPTYVGLHARAEADMSCKVVRKQDPMARVGVVARAGASLRVVEYTELPDAERHARDADGGLRFWAGNVAIHLFRLDFVRRVAANADTLLPFHLSAKKVPALDAEGRVRTPEAPNGYKLERFVFDALPAARAVCVVETRADEEFSAIKNAEGTESPESCRAALVAQYRRWLEAAGVAPSDDVVRIEIDHSVIDGPEEAAAAGPTNLAQAVRTAGGRDA